MDLKMDESVDVESHPDFAVIWSFFSKFGKQLDLEDYLFTDVSNWISSSLDQTSSLVEMMVKLMRKTGMRVDKQRWQKHLIRAAMKLDYSLATELQSSGFNSLSIARKLRLLKLLCEMQFDDNMKFKTNINTEEPDGQRLKPVGRDEEGLVYWHQEDTDLNIRLYVEDEDEDDDAGWKVVCRSKNDIENLIKHLRDDPLDKSKGENSDEEEDIVETKFQKFLKSQCTTEAPQEKVEKEENKSVCTAGKNDNCPEKDENIDNVTTKTDNNSPTVEAVSTENPQSDSIVEKCEDEQIKSVQQSASGIMSTKIIPFSSAAIVSDIVSENEKTKNEDKPDLSVIFANEIADDIIKVVVDELVSNVVQKCDKCNSPEVKIEKTIVESNRIDRKPVIFANETGDTIVKNIDDELVSNIAQKCDDSNSTKIKMEETNVDASLLKIKHEELDNEAIEHSNVSTDNNLISCSSNSNIPSLNTQTKTAISDNQITIPCANDKPGSSLTQNEEFVPKSKQDVELSHQNDTTKSEIESGTVSNVMNGHCGESEKVDETSIEKIEKSSECGKDAEDVESQDKDDRREDKKGDNMMGTNSREKGDLQEDEIVGDEEKENKERLEDAEEQKSTPKKKGRKKRRRAGASKKRSRSATSSATKKSTSNSQQIKQKKPKLSRLELLKEEAESILHMGEKKSQDGGDAYRTRSGRRVRNAKKEEPEIWQTLEDENQKKHKRKNSDVDEDFYYTEKKRGSRSQSPVQISPVKEIQRIVNDDTPCMKCGLYSHPETILLCDGCDKGHHMACLTPPLMIVPYEEWFCPKCSQQKLITRLKEIYEELENKLKLHQRKTKQTEYKKLLNEYTGISTSNIIAEQTKPAKSRPPPKKRRKSYSSNSESEDFSSPSSPEIKTTRRCRAKVSYDFSSFDKTIMEAIGEDIVEKPEGDDRPVSGKDMRTIIAAEMGEEADDKEEFLSGRRKKRKLTNLNSSEDEAAYSGSNYSVSASEDDEQSEVEEEYRESNSTGSEDEVGRGRRSQRKKKPVIKPTKRSKRLRRKRIQEEDETSLSESSEYEEEAPQKKIKKKKKWNTYGRDSTEDEYVPPRSVKKDRHFIDDDDDEEEKEDNKKETRKRKISRALDSSAGEDQKEEKEVKKANTKNTGDVSSDDWSSLSSNAANSSDEEGSISETDSHKKGKIVVTDSPKIENTTETHSTPAAEDSTPAAEDSTPAAEDSTPTAENSTPAAEDSTPAAEDCDKFQT